jgi:hypothetical protein
MTAPRPAALSGLAIALSTLVATLAQCGGDRAPLAARVPQDPAQPAARAPAAPPADAVRLLVSGSMLGRLEPCGCASGQLGGLARRMQHVAEARNYDLLLEGGNLVDTATELDLMKLLTANTVLFGMSDATRYDALGVGANDLRLPRQDWLAMLGATPVVATNLASTDDGWVGKPFVEKDVRGVRVRVASFVLSLPEALRGDGATVRLVPVQEAWTKALDGASADTRKVVLAHGTDTEVRALIPQLQPAPDLVVGVDDGYVEPTPTAAPVGGVPLVFAGIRGRVLLAVSLFRENGVPRAICELVPLPGSKTLPGGGGDPDVRKAILQHRDDVKNMDVLGKLVRQHPTANGAAYVGNSTCKPCHEPEYAIWKDSKHAHAWQTLVDAEKDPRRYGWPVTAYPDCVSCHVVGYGEQTGFVSGEETRDLADVGCERCHGAGSDHVTSGGTKKLGIIAGIEPSLLCVQCHDFEQSPTFVYGERWAHIAHGRGRKPTAKPK